MRVDDQSNTPAGRPPDPSEQHSNYSGGERADGCSRSFFEQQRPDLESRADAEKMGKMGETVTPPHPPRECVVVTVTDPLGLHLRSGRDVVRIASQFQAQITASNLSRNSGAVNMKSILQLMQLQARHGHDLQLAASGPDAAAAIDALCSLF